VNYFDLRAAAERYSKGRPAFHSNTIKHIANYLQLRKKLDSALDVACGTGLSMHALLAIATHVYGTDISPEMLKHALHSDKINYSIAPADRQPFANSFFDLITVSSGVHWFDIDKFLEEAYRLLKSTSWLVLYENHFIAEMVGTADFAKWFADVYLKRFPSPARNNSYLWTNENLHPKNFGFIGEERFKNAVALNKKQLALYFTTQSNVISAVERNEITFEEVEHWLKKELASFFEDDHTERVINYGNWIKYVQRAN
jgi:ubiquinone/menaquinone biosynthesis C-methylase UbiE